MKQLLARVRNSKWVRHTVLAGIAVPVVLASAIAVFPAAPANADPNSPGTEAAPKSQGQRLERLFKFELNQLGNAQHRLDQAARLVTKVQDRIDSLKSQGKDASKLEKALASLKASIATAQGYYESARSILDTHAGFDANGQVTDPAQARETVTAAAKAERDFQKTIGKIVRHLAKERKQITKLSKGNQAAPNSNAEANRT